MSPEIAERDKQFGDLIAFLKRTGQEAHTSRGQTLILKPRRPKRSRIDRRLK